MTIEVVIVVASAFFSIFLITGIAALLFAHGIESAVNEDRWSLMKNDDPWFK